MSQCIFTFPNPSNWVDEIAYGAGYMMLAYTNEIEFWDLQTKTLYKAFTFEDHTAAAFSPSGTTFAVSPKEGGIQIWDVATGKMIKTFAGNVEFYSLSYSPDERHILAHCEETAANVYSLKSGELIYTLEIPQPPVPPQPTTWLGKLAAKLKGTPAAVRTVIIDVSQYSPTGKNIAISSDDCKISLWDAQLGKMITSLEVNDGNMYLNAFNYSPSGQYIALSTWENIIQIWDAKTGKQLKTFTPEVETEEITALTYTPEGKRLLIGLTNGIIQTWDIQEGQKINEFTAYDEEDDVDILIFSPDGNTLATGSATSGIIKLWQIYNY